MGFKTRKGFRGSKGRANETKEEEPTKGVNDSVGEDLWEGRSVRGKGKRKKEIKKEIKTCTTARFKYTHKCKIGEGIEATESKMEERREETHFNK